MAPAASTVIAAASQIQTSQKRLPAAGAAISGCGVRSPAWALPARVVSVCLGAAAAAGKAPSRSGGGTGAPPVGALPVSRSTSNAPVICVSVGAAAAAGKRDSGDDGGNGAGTPRAGTLNEIVLPRVS